MTAAYKARLAAKKEYARKRNNYEATFAESRRVHGGRMYELSKPSAAANPFVERVNVAGAVPERKTYGTKQHAMEWDSTKYRSQVNHEAKGVADGLRVHGNEAAHNAFAEGRAVAKIEAEARSKISEVVQQDKHRAMMDYHYGESYKGPRAVRGWRRDEQSARVVTSPRFAQPVRPGRVEANGL